MKRLAILFEANINDRKGLVNAVINRAKYLKGIAGYEVDVFCLQGYPAGLNAILRREKRCERKDWVEVDGVKVQLLWYKSFLIDDILSHRLNYKPVLQELFSEDIYKKLKTYDLVSSHGVSTVANKLKQKNNIPYTATWHGTDIHTQPYRSAFQKRLITKVLRESDMNFFVSEALMKKAEELAGTIPAMVSYNGVNTSFARYDEDKREQFREKYGVKDQKVVAFVGNLVPVKNVMTLPDIFSKVKNAYNGAVVFWIIGGGVLKSKLEEVMESMNLPCTFWGNQEVEVMPQFYNSMDVLVLPSINEGLGMVLIEALKCGANAVGSRVGGIPEVIGEENAFELGPYFTERITERICLMLSRRVEQRTESEFSWEETVKKEDVVYKTCLYK